MNRGRYHHPMGRGAGEIQEIVVAGIHRQSRRPSRPPPRPGECRPVLMSIQPQWSRLIQDGTKTIELRRQRSGCEPGTKVAIYTSFPVKRVEALATVATVHALPPEKLWRAVGSRSASTRDDFFNYLGDLDVAYGIEFSDVKLLTPLPLDRPGPQSWCYLWLDRDVDKSILEACSKV